MTRRTYNQYCGLAYALDVVGERWTVLIVRELMSGPKRYSDLTSSLEGIGTSLLATRIRQLEDRGIITRRQLPPPAAVLVYQLTDTGRELAESLMPLAIWGIRHQLSHTRSPDERYRAEWSLPVIASLIDRHAIDSVTGTIEFRIDNTAAQLHLHDQQVDVLAGQAHEKPDATVTTDAATLTAVGAGRLDLPSALADGRITATGDPSILQVLVTSLTAPATPSDSEKPTPSR
ncbi:HxlR family transcriptional regulator [Mycolicibacterium conceptionense]|uniref:HxlR family transcriptional regulator n=1 Tax=Mycolicibacterium conceptionense TaxID=451644 RepID=A0A0U1DKJ0_9MYCO|nr:winged helix-turn-helix transcriptional regulator [Mycolicibacterium conceptionense]CQD16624.1 HxlR family transcriptional regulator [Mycolicibacterium conceptionense]